MTDVEHGDRSTTASSGDARASGWRSWFAPPTLWRSETLSAMYEAVGRGELTADDARTRLAYVNGMKIRLLGDAVLRRRAWELADRLGLPTTFAAEYVALAQLRKCTLVSADGDLLKRVGDLVPTATIDALL